MGVFYFCQDVRKQQQMAQLTKGREHLFETIRTCLLLFETTRQVINEMQGSVHFQFIVFNLFSNSTRENCFMFGAVRRSSFIINSVLRAF